MHDSELSSSADAIPSSDGHLCVGQPVRIVRGPLRGFHGVVASLKSGRQVEIRAPDTLPGVRIRISAELLEILRA